MATATLSAQRTGRRWWILAVLCISLLVVGIDGTVVNVALPDLVRELGASSSQLQWVVDSYELLFASFLLLAGSMGDKFGRKPALTAGLVLFGVGSLASGLAGSPTILILTRAVQGFGAAFIMPSTLSILTNVFSEEERGRAIGIWAGVSGLGVAIGPITGGWLLEHFWWGSIFMVNLPVIGVALAAGFLLVPNSKDPESPPVDYLGSILSVLALLALLYAIIQAPTDGWTSPPIIGGFLAGAALLTVFTLWEMHIEHPLLDVSFFANARFSAASAAITLVFFAMFGSLFFLSQYLQFVMGYNPLQAGLRLVPVAAALMVAAPLSSKLVSMAGTKIVVTVGLLLVAAAMVLFSRVTVTSGYELTAAVLVIIGVGMALAMAPATDSIMGSLPPEKAGVGSAVNDTTREVGGALGVAILGSITSSVYRTEVTNSPIFAAAQRQSAAGAEVIRSSVGAAAEVAKHLPANLATILTDVTNHAFVHGLQRTVLVGAGVAVLGAIVAAVFLPARPARAEAADYEELGGLIAATARQLGPDPARRRDVAGAVLQALTEAGFSSLTFHGVATRAGISTETMDRYWSNKVELVVDALRSISLDHSVPDTGSFRDDCTQYLRVLAADLTDPRLEPAVAGLIGAAARDPSLAATFREQLVEPRRAAVRTIIDRADARGEITTPVDRDVFTDTLLAPLFYRGIITGQPVGAVVADDVIEVALAGTTRTDGGTPEPPQ